MSRTLNLPTGIEYVVGVGMPRYVGPVWNDGKVSPASIVCTLLRTHCSVAGAIQYFVAADILAETWERTLR